MSVWIEVKAVLEQAPEDWAVLTEIFARHGIEGTLQTDFPPSLSGYLWADGQPPVAELARALTEFGASVETREVEDEDWSESWKQYFQPRRIGTRFVVRPTWEPFDSGPGDLVIVLDPGQAFGTGDHPTTRLCLELMEQAELSSADVIDVGCGSGVLSIGAALLGARRVRAIDIEPQSVEATQANAELNGVQVPVWLGDGFAPLPDAEPVDCVLSNIISAALIRISGEAAARVKPGGTWIVSGVIERNWPDVLAAAERAGFVLVTRLQEDDWIAATLRRL